MDFPKGDSVGTTDPKSSKNIHLFYPSPRVLVSGITPGFFVSLKTQEVPTHPSKLQLFQPIGPVTVFWFIK